MHIEFDDSLRTGISEVDSQHRMLIDLYNELEEAVWNGKANQQMNVILAQLYKYTKTHFAAEEALLEVTGYPELAQHQLEHQRLAERLRKFVLRYRQSRERISKEMLEFVRGWITSHIKECDHSYVAHVQQNLHLVAAQREAADVSAPVET